jgi:hypothetical protein
LAHPTLVAMTCNVSWCWGESSWPNHLQANEQYNNSMFVWLKNRKAHLDTALLFQ